MKEEIAKNLIGLIIDDKYELESLIGTGATGNVYKGKHLLLEIPIAIKILHRSLITKEVAQKRFRQEARLAMAVRHDNAMSIMDFGVWNDEIYYLVMEYIDGISLSDLLKEHNIIPIERTIKLAKQICQALSAAHDKNIVHRDLKPSNIMIINAGNEDELIKVIDFSIAKSTAQNSNLTAKDTVLGTPQYVSPEQVQAEGVGIHSDIYSLGIIIYEMLTGTLPFKAKTAAAYFVQHVHAPPIPLRKLNAEIPVALEKVVLKALAKTADQRPQSMEIFAAQLEEAAFTAGTDELTPITAANPRPALSSTSAPTPLNPGLSLQNSEMEATSEHRYGNTGDLAQPTAAPASQTITEQMPAVPPNAYEQPVTNSAPVAAFKVPAASATERGATSQSVSPSMPEINSLSGSTKREQPSSPQKRKGFFQRLIDLLLRREWK